MRASIRIVSFQWWNTYQKQRMFQKCNCQYLALPYFPDFCSIFLPSLIFLNINDAICYQSALGYFNSFILQGCDFLVLFLSQKIEIYKIRMWLRSHGMQQCQEHESHSLCINCIQQIRREVLITHWCSSVNYWNGDGEKLIQQEKSMNHFRNSKCMIFDI